MRSHPDKMSSGDTHQIVSVRPWVCVGVQGRLDSCKPDKPIVIYLLPIPPEMWSAEALAPPPTTTTTSRSFGPRETSPTYRG